MTAASLHPDVGARDRAVAAALELFKAGRAAEAAAAFRDVLLADPEDAEALHFLGVTLDAGGDPAGAARAIEGALERGETASRRSNYAMVLGRLGRHDEAVENLRRALALRPDYPEALNNLGVSLQSLGRGEEAVEAYGRAVALRPRYAEAWTNLGHALRALRRDDKAVEAYEAALGVDPGAEPAGRGAALLALGRVAEAVAAGRRAVERRPDSAAAHLDLGNALRAADDLPGSETASRRALALRPGDVAGYNNLAVVLQEQGRLDEALTVLGLAAALAPEDPETHHHSAMILFSQERWAEGWALYDWRLKTGQAGDGYRAYEGLPQWRGEPVAGQTVLLVPEQGMGDMIQFVRYAPLLAARGARVLLGTYPALRRLFETVPGVERLLVPTDHRPAHDFYCPMLSLPRAFGTAADTIPAAVPYLTAEPALAAAWQARIGAAGPGLKVGLVWAGNPKHLNDRRRSIGFAQLAPLLAVPGVRWFSLQVGPRAADLAGAPPGAVADLAPALDDFAETAAALMAIDLLVTVDTSVAHLAGALGRPVWMLLPAEADWRWGTAGAATPWYPTMWLFRRGRGEGWAPVLDAVASALRARAAPAPTLRAPRADGRALDVLFDWGVASSFGWGLYGLNLLLAWADRADLRAACVAPHRIEEIDVDPLEREAIRPALARSAAVARDLSAVAGRRVTTSGIMLHALHNGLLRDRAVHGVNLQGRPNLAVAFLDRTELPAERVEALKHYPMIVAGSSWNAALLREAGAPRVELLLQGVDTSAFHPAPRRRAFGDRFVVFSGGKLEHRKGQDLVLRAFRAFAARHPDALLLTAWSSPWTDGARDLVAAPDLQPPTFGPDGALDVQAWCVANGIPRHQVRPLGLLPNRVLPRLLREADVALFPNRAEGGTNLVAMECMACGVPTILSANTGHLDLLDSGGATPLLRQAPISDPGCRGWGESDVDEIVETLDRAYRDRDALAVRGQAGARFMTGLTWRRQMDRLATLVLACR